MTRSLLALLIYASLASAQPWQWELTNPTWQNPTNFPGFSDEVPPFADLDGDGVSELIVGSINTQVFAVDTTSPNLRWREVAFFAGGPSFSGLSIWQNLDEDPALELVSLPNYTGDSVRCWEVNTSGEQWEWVYRPDLLVDRLPQDATSFEFGVVWGQFDTDEEEECAVIDTNGSFEKVIDIYSNTALGDWTLDESFAIGDYFSIRIYSGDFDSDGDLDIAVLGEVADAGTETSIIENTLDGLLFHDFNWNLSGLIGGGNIDQDSNFEFIYHQQCNWSRLGPDIREFVTFDSVRVEYNLSEMGSQLIGELLFPDGPRLVGISYEACHSFWDSPPYEYSTVMRYLSTNGWIDYSSLYPSTDVVSFADVTGDGRKDILNTYRLRVSSWPPVMSKHWTLLENNAEPDRDVFHTLSGVHFVNADYNFPRDYTSPRLGDVDGNGVAELFAVLSDTSNHDARRFWVFNVTQLSPDEIFIPAENLLTDLPLVVSSYEVVDLDQDGAVEVMTYFESSWHIYFYRNGHWVTYEGVLPEFTTPIRGFADWDNSGTMDIFTDVGIYLNMSPSAADDPVAAPSSFTLSSYPNPFNAQTTITFDLPRADEVSLKLFDLLGREVETLLNEKMLAGTHTLNYSASALPSGVYFIRFMSNEINATHKLLLLK